MDRLFSFVGLCLLSFLPVAVIQAIAVEDLSKAAQLSQSFAVASVAFSFFFMAQRQYVNINGPILKDALNDLYFRVLNSFLATLITILILALYGAPYEIIVFCTAIKVSESIADYMFGYLNNSLGFKKGAFRFFSISCFRFLLLAISGAILLFYFDLDLLNIILLIGFVSISYFLVYFVLTTIKFKAVSPSSDGKVSLRPFFVRYKLLSPFVFSAGMCSFLVASPRWFVPVSDENNSIFLIAFSLVPIWGVLLSTLFASYIDTSKKKLSTGFVRLTIVVLLLNGFMITFQPVWRFIIYHLYGFEERLSEVFVDSLIAGSLFFSGILFANFFKFTKPILEGFAYLIGISVLVLTYFSGLNIFYSIYISAISIFSISLFSLKAKR